MTEPLRLGIAGLGTVGIGVVKIIRRHAALLEARTGRPVVISAVSARDASKDRGYPAERLCLGKRSGGAGRAR